MHKNTKNHSYVGSSGQTLTTNVPVNPCDSQLCHQTHVALCLVYVAYTLGGGGVHKHRFINVKLYLALCVLGADLSEHPQSFQT